MTRVCGSPFPNDPFSAELFRRGRALHAGNERSATRHLRLEMTPVHAAIRAQTRQIVSPASPSRPPRSDCRCSDGQKRSGFLSVLRRFRRGRIFLLLTALSEDLTTEWPLNLSPRASFEIAVRTKQQTHGFMEFSRLLHRESFRSTLNFPIGAMSSGGWVLWCSS